MNCRRQALQFCLDPAVVVVIQICNEFLLEVFHGLKFLQIQQLAFENSKEVFNYSIIQTVSLSGSCSAGCLSLGASVDTVYVGTASPDQNGE